METGTIFDIKEFAVHDGPGIRTTVFMKGCPLACTWCHNPEGLSAEPQVLRSPAGERMVGQVYSSQELAARLNKQAHILKANEGGVTFSGGEPLSQARFVTEVIDCLTDTHVLLDTSGCGSEEDFRSLIERVQLVYFDLKLVDEDLHRRYTRCGNGASLRNLRILDETDVPFVIRVPLIPGVTDTEKNLTAIAKATHRLKGLVRIDLLPYNRAAGAKYEAAGMVFEPGFDEQRPARVDLTVFEQMGLTARVA